MNSEEIYKELEETINLSKRQGNETITLDGKKIANNIPSNISELKHIKSLYLIGFNFTRLPLGIYELENLECLKILWIPNLKFTREISVLKSLKTLCLHYFFGEEKENRTNIPSGLNHLQYLENLELQGTYLSQFKTESKVLKKIKKLTLNGLQHKNAIKGICNFENLEELYIWDVGLGDGWRTIELPDDIYKLKNLTRLVTQDTKIKGLDKLKNLEYLKMWRISLKKFPDEICKLDKLKELSFSSSYREPIELPRCIEKLNSLTSLHFQHHTQIKFPKNFEPNNDIEELTMRIPTDGELPSFIWKLTKLKKLELKGNELKEIPDKLFNMTYLEALTLHGNEIKEIPDKIYRLQNLKYLDISNMGLELFPQSILRLQNLEYLNIGFSKIKELPVEIIKLKKIRDLRFESTNIDEIPSFIEYLNQLETLNVAGSNIRNYPIEITNLKNLKYIILGPTDYPDFEEETEDAIAITEFINERMIMGGD